MEYKINNITFHVESGETEAALDILVELYKINKTTKLNDAIVIKVDCEENNRKYHTGLITNTEWQLKRILLIFGCLSIVYIARSQAVMISFGPTYNTTKQIVPIVNGQKGDANTDYMFSISYEHFFAKKPLSLFASFSKFDGYTFIFFEKGGFISYGNEIGGTGFSGVNVNRIDAGITYRIINKKRKFYLSPFVATGVQISKKTGFEIYSELIPINGPNYFELEPISADPRNTTQIVPSLGFRTGFVFWKRLDIGLSFQGIYAFKPYQKMYLKYQYKGVVQPTAEYEATGTGLFVTLGIGYRFAKLIK